MASGSYPISASQPVHGLTIWLVVEPPIQQNISKYDIFSLCLVRTL